MHVSVPLVFLHFIQSGKLFPENSPVHIQDGSSHINKCNQDNLPQACLEGHLSGDSRLFLVDS